MEHYTSALHLMQKAPAVTLSSIEEDGSPCTRAMLNLRNRSRYSTLVDLFDDGSLRTYLTTNTSSAKMKQLRRDGRVCLYYMIPEHWWGLSLSGKVTEIHSRDIRHRIWQKDWELYYPGGPDDEDYTILEVNPEKGRLYKQLRAWNLKPSV